ncbi:MAG: hypothetical protein HOP18_14810 [Deltaproteobacteria bacterium]|nr:hypothetical protein [Deltaproteobacteria bacterium]
MSKQKVKSRKVQLFKTLPPLSRNSTVCTGPPSSGMGAGGHPALGEACYSH